jgi:hypothetical protein
MADIYGILISVLCPTQGSDSVCRDFINAPGHQTLAPLGPLFYFLLFPSVFIILFVFILSGRMVHQHAGVRLLFGVTAFIFIIISGWYPVFLFLSEFWYMFAIMLIGLWVFVKMFWGGGGGNGPKGSNMPGMGGLNSLGIGDQIKTRIRKEMTGEMKTLRETIDLDLRELEAIQNRIKSGDSEAWKAYPPIREACNQAISEYSRAISIGGVAVGGGLKSKIERLEKMIEGLDSLQRKH